MLKIDRDKWKWLTDRMYYLKGDLTNSESFQNLKAKLAEVDSGQRCGGNYLFYLAVADRFFGSTVEQIGKAGLADESGGVWRRVVIEKPFGHDLASAKALNQQILNVLAETQIYRIDHFLGKETVQNLLMFRFANGMFEHIWNRDRIDHVQITVAETVGVEQRGGFYEKTGAMRDMIPNHVFQLLAFTAMEAPNSVSADAVRSEKAKVIEAIRELGPEDIPLCAVRGQYDAGAIGDKPAIAYREEQDVAPEFDSGDLRCHEIVNRKLAMVGRAFLHPDGKAFECAQDRDRDSLQGNARDFAQGYEPCAQLVTHSRAAG